MPEFLKLTTVEAARRTFLAAVPAPEFQAERIASELALGRVLAESVKAADPLPPFARSTVDGFAVRAADTHGASPGLPAYLKLIGEVRMGSDTDLELTQGQAAIVHTGGMLPAGADAVVMLEDTQSVDEREIEVLKPIGSGGNVLKRGEDVEVGDVVLGSGIQLGPQEIGGLMALGVTEVAVAPRPRVAILSTGDEVVPPDQQPGPGQVRDVNSYSLSALLQAAGAEPIRYGIIADQAKVLAEKARHAHANSDMLLITAGSSVSERDITADAVAELGAPGILVHGVSMRPGKPTILAVCDGIPVAGLPGNPVSAIVASSLFVLPAVRKLLGIRGPEWQPTIQARLTTNVSSTAGREDYLPVQLHVSPEGVRAEPVFGRSNLIFTLVRADGLVRIPGDSTGLDAGAAVEVRLF